MGTPKMASDKPGAVHYGCARDRDCTSTWKPPGMNTETRARGVHSSRPDGYTHNDAESSLSAYALRTET